MYKMFAVILAIVFISISFRTKDDSLIDHFWLDSMPKTIHDPFAYYVFEHDGNGVFCSGTQAKYTAEAFKHKHSPESVIITWLADNVINKTNYNITHEVNGEFDLKLVVKEDPRHGNMQHVYWGNVHDEGLKKKVKDFITH